MHGCAVTARQQSCASWGADRSRMKVGIAQAIVGQCIEGGCLDQPAECAGSTITYIVDQNPDHVGRAGWCFHRLRPPLFRLGESSANDALIRLRGLSMKRETGPRRKDER